VSGRRGPGSGSRDCFAHQEREALSAAKRRAYSARMTAIDPKTERAIRVFLERIAGRYPLAGARLYGSRARGDGDKYSDADLAVFLKGPRGDAMSAGVEMAGVAFDVLLETEILVSPLPIWEDEWEHPERYSNPRLLENIRREGVAL